jgi:hypothetical protein
MAAATVAAKPVVSTKPVVKTPVTTAAKPVMAAKSAAPSKPAAPVVDELAEYAAAKKKPPTASRNDASATPAQSATAPNESKFDASDALGVGLSIASIIPVVRGGRTLYQAGKKLYQTYKAAKDAIKNRPKLDRPGTVSGEGFVMRDFKDPNVVTKAPIKALPAPRKGDITDVVAKKKGGNVKKMAHGGSVKTSAHASKRGDGIATKGKTRGKMV